MITDVTSLCTRTILVLCLCLLQPVLCELVHGVLAEYTQTAMFMWMFLEGMYLHNTLVISVFSGKPNYVLYNCIGWGK